MLDAPRPATVATMPSGALVAQAREMFFSHGITPAEGLAPHIRQSWIRCRQADSSSADTAPLGASQLRDRREQSMRLLECAQPELDFLAGHALDAGCVVVLSDADGLILDEIGSADFLPKAQRVALTPGALWSEGSRGTNAIGTALLERKPLMVLGGEHFLSQHGSLGCAAAPIFTGRGDLAGLLDISGDVSSVTPHALGLVRMAAAQVEHRMMLAGATGHLLRFHSRPSLLGSSREGLLVVDDGRLVAANRVALDLLGSQWSELLDTPIDRLLGLRWTRLQEGARLITLPGGQQIAAAVEPSLQGPGPHRFMKRRPIETTSLPTPAGRNAATAGDHSPDVSDALAPWMAKAVKVIDADLPVLVTGETGSGKEVFSHRLHLASRRHKGPFVAVNCAALPEALIESELFGYEAGAFTGARRRGAPGKIREAHGGILFLDEIGDMPLSMQTRLLRVLEDKIVTPLGASTGVKVDFSLVCATHRDLDEMVSAGSFRSDLRYRVNGYMVQLPALRDRADRHALIDTLFNELAGPRGLRLSRGARAQLAARSWPGNVRELHAVLRTCAALADDHSVIDEADLPFERDSASSEPQSSPAGESAQGSSRQSWPLGGAAKGVAMPWAHGDTSPARLSSSVQALADLERQAVDQALVDCDGNIARAARQLGIHRSTLYRRLAPRAATPEV